MPPLTSLTVRRRLLAGLGLSPLAPLLLNACSQPPALQLASHVWPGYELMFMAQNMGWLDEQSVQLLGTASATESISLLRNRKVDAAALTLDEVLRLRSEGIPLTVVLVFNISAGADVIIARPEIRVPADLKGRTIGAETSALGFLMLQLLLDQAGLTADEVTVVPVGIDGHVRAWASGALDALITYEPTASALLRGRAHRLTDSRHFPERIFDVLAVRTDRLHLQSANLKKLTGAHFRALEHMRRNPQDAAHRMAERLAIPGNQVMETFRGIHLPNLAQNRQLLGQGTDSRVHGAAVEIQKILQRQGNSGLQDNLNGLVDGRHLAEQEARP